MIFKLIKVPIVLLICIFIIGNSTTVFAGNNIWSAQAIGTFLYNKVDAPNVLKDEKYTENITREEFAELIIGLYAKIRSIDKNNIEVKENPFKDTNNVDVQRAYSLGIIQGISKNTFKPKDNITREQIATMITRFLNIQGINTSSSNNLNSFKDKNDISKWGFDSMSYCAEQGIIKGLLWCGDELLKPKDPASVEQIVTMLYRISIKNNWINDDSNIYINGFFIPKKDYFIIDEYSSRPENKHSSISVDGKEIKCITQFKIDWKKVNNSKELEDDLSFIFNQNNLTNNKEQMTDLLKNSTSLNREIEQKIETNKFIIEIYGFCDDKKDLTTLQILEKKLN